MKTLNSESLMSVNRKIFLDDFRRHPYGWVRTKTVADTWQEMLQRSENERLEALSLDNDLGDCDILQGQVILFKLYDKLAEHNGGSIPEEDLRLVPEHLIIHTVNPVGAETMQRTARRIRTLLRSQVSDWRPMRVTRIWHSGKSAYDSNDPSINPWVHNYLS